MHRTEIESSFEDRLGQEVSESSTKWSCEDKSDPKEYNVIDIFCKIMEEHHEEDDPTRHIGTLEIPESETIWEKISKSRTESIGEEYCYPKVYLLTSFCDRIDIEMIVFLVREPECYTKEHDQDDTPCRISETERPIDTIRYLRTKCRRSDDHEPELPWSILLREELDSEEYQKSDTCDRDPDIVSEVECLRDVVSECLPESGGDDLGEPEDESDLSHLVEWDFHRG